MWSEVVVCRHQGIQDGGHHSSLIHGFNQSPPGFQAMGPVALLNDSAWRLSHVVVHQMSKKSIAQNSCPASLRDPGWMLHCF